MKERNRREGKDLYVDRVSKMLLSWRVDSFLYGRKCTVLVRVDTDSKSPTELEDELEEDY